MSAGALHGLVVLLVACPSSRPLPDSPDGAPTVDVSGMAPLRGTRTCTDRPVALLVDLDLAHPRAALVVDGPPVALTEVSLELLGEAQHVRRYRLTFVYEEQIGVAWIREERAPGGGRYAHTIRAIGMTSSLGFDVGGTVP